MKTIKQTNNVLYTAKTHTVGDRQYGVTKSTDDHHDIKLPAPPEGVGPEQLFA